MCRDAESLSAALFRAATEGDMEEVSRLVDLGAPVNAGDARGKTALMGAAYHGHTDVVDLLIGTHGADVEATTEEGFTPLIAAAGKGQTDTVDLLVGTHNAYTEATDLMGWTALVHAAIRGHAATVILLAEKHNADVHVVDPEGWTAARHGLYFGHLEVFAALIELGASLGPTYDQITDPYEPDALEGGDEGDQVDRFIIPEGEDSELTEPPLCAICHHFNPKIRFHPCGHTACLRCSRQVQSRRQSCHACRQRIVDMQAVYL